MLNHTCRDCKRTVQLPEGHRLIICPLCGARQTPATAAPTTRVSKNDLPQNTLKNTKIKWALGALVVTGIAGLLFHLQSRRTDSINPEILAAVAATPDRRLALSHCQDAVRERLKSPASARFAGYGDKTVNVIGDNPWIVGGVVDSQNSFGALLRSRYQCIIKREGSSISLGYINIE